MTIVLPVEGSVDVGSNYVVLVRLLAFTISFMECNDFCTTSSCGGVRGAGISA